VKENDMKLTIGYPEEFGVGKPVTVDYEPGQPITVEGVDLTLTFEKHGDALTINTNEAGNQPVVRPLSGNLISVTPEGKR
jgi:hypothetical protein